MGVDGEDEEDDDEEIGGREVEKAGGRRVLGGIVRTRKPGLGGVDGRLSGAKETKLLLTCVVLESRDLVAPNRGSFSKRSQV